jgi:uracil phosphoribosyltransferase
MASLPPHVHVSQHPSLVAKLSQLRSKHTSAKEVKVLIHEIGLILAIEALAKAIKPADGPKVGVNPPAAIPIANG